MGFSIANLDIGGVFSGLGTLAKDLRTAFTGKEPIDANQAAQLALKVQELETSIEVGRLSVMQAEAASLDKWTSRARPAFLYVVYIFILAAFPMGLAYAFFPGHAKLITEGVKAWLDSIPSDMWVLFGFGYGGYTAARSYDKVKAK
jgi:hypothetical protein